MIAVYAFFAFCIGSSVGSFLNVVVDRLPAGRSLVSPPSACDACHKRLAGPDLVPVVSYLMLRGTCRYCGAVIPVRVLLTEAAMGSLITGLYLQHGFSPELFALGAGVGVMLTVAGIDLEHKLILDVVTVPAFVASVAIAAFWPDLGFPRTFFGDADRLASFLNSLIAAGGALAGFLLVYFLSYLIYPSSGGMGEGDVKLAIVMGAFLGYPGVVIALWLGIVSGGIVAVALWVSGRKSRKDMIPYGVFLAGGAIAAIMMVGWITTRYREQGLDGFLL